MGVSTTKITGSMLAYIGIPLVIIFIAALVVVTISGRILGQINKSPSTCRDDPNIDSAQGLSMWIVILASILSAIALLGFIVLAVLFFASFGSPA